jgi:hypothetical protein
MAAGVNGNVVAIVVVRTDPGYRPDSGKPGNRKPWWPSSVDGPVATLHRGVS